MMQNGEIQTEPTENKAVQEIFKAYLNGSSLLAIANLSAFTSTAFYELKMKVQIKSVVIATDRIV